MGISDTRIELSRHIFHAGLPWALVITQMPFNFHSFCLGGIPVSFSRQAQYGRRRPSHKPDDASHNTPDTIHGVAAMQPCRKTASIPSNHPRRQQPPSALATLLLGDTDGPATATGGLGVLSTDTEAPVVSKTTVGPDLLQALKVITELGVDTVGEHLRVLAIDNIALSVEEP